MTPLSVLIGARIRRIDAPHDTLLSLVLSSREVASVLVLSFAPGAEGVGLVPKRPLGQPASSFVLKLRKELEGARLLSFAHAPPATLTLILQRAESQRQLLCDFAAPRIALLDDTGVALANHLPDAARRTANLQLTWPDSIEELTTRGPLLLTQGAASALVQRRTQLTKLVRNSQKRLERRLIALTDDIARAEQAPSLRARANLVMTNLHAIKRGSASVQLLDYALDPPALIDVALDPARGAQEQVEAWFKQARRFERGAELAAQRDTATRSELERLNELSAQLTTADEAMLEELAQAARALGVRGIGASADTSSKAALRRTRHKPYRELRGHNQRTILVGKGAEDNDTLTREQARPQDLWLHARDVSGAHVVVPLERNEICPQELLLDAAQLAAHFSDARNQAIVDVSYTPKRYVRKPRNAPKGTVQLEREKVLRLHQDPKRLAQLLASEIRD